MVVVMAGFTLFGGSRAEGHPLQEFGNNPGMLITWMVWFPLLPDFGLPARPDLVHRLPHRRDRGPGLPGKEIQPAGPESFQTAGFLAGDLSFLVLDYIEEFLE